MVYGELFDDPDGTREEIMAATYEALCEHGYAELSIQDIADRFGKSKSLLYHHYDSKDELLLDFLEYMLEGFKENIPSDVDGTADEHLDAVLDHMFAETMSEERHEFTRAMVELRAQAANDERYRERFTRHDSFIVESQKRLIRDGIEEGVFVNADADEVAAFLFTIISGSMELRVTNDRADPLEVRKQLDEYLREVLLKDG